MDKLTERQQIMILTGENDGSIKDKKSEYAEERDDDDDEAKKNRKAIRDKRNSELLQVGKKIWVSKLGWVWPGIILLVDKSKGYDLIPPALKECKKTTDRYLLFYFGTICDHVWLSGNEKLIKDFNENQNYLTNARMKELSYTAENIRSLNNAIVDGQNFDENRFEAARNFTWYHNRFKSQIKKVINDNNNKSTTTSSTSTKTIPTTISTKTTTKTTKTITKNDNEKSIVVKKKLIISDDVEVKQIIKNKKINENEITPKLNETSKTQLEDSILLTPQQVKELRLKKKKFL